MENLTGKHFTLFLSHQRVNKQIEPGVVGVMWKVRAVQMTIEGRRL
jgi:hypothetical protein